MYFIYSIGVFSTLEKSIISQAFSTNFEYLRTCVLYLPLNLVTITVLCKNSTVSRTKTTWSIALLLFSEVLDLIMLFFVGIPTIGFIQELANLSECRENCLDKLATYFLKPDAAKLLINGIRNLTELMDFGTTRSKRGGFDIPDFSEKVKPELIYPVVLFAMMIVSVFIVFILAIHVYRVYIACCLISIELKTRNSILSSTNSSDIPV